MIKRIFVSEIDRTNLSKFKTTEAQDKRIDYSKVVVNKPWGYEYLMFENDYVAIWILHLKKGHQNSLHCHPRKKTSMMVLSGKIRASTLTDWFELKELDGLMYEEGLFHTQKALSNNVFLLEIETPPIKKDLVRLRDSYGREGKAYEGKNKLSKNISKFNYIFFEDSSIQKGLRKKINDTEIMIKKCSFDLLEKEVDFVDKKKVYSILEEKVIDSKHRELFGVGSIFHPAHVRKFDTIRLFKNCLLLSIEKAS